MSAHLHIERLVITGLAACEPATVLRREIEQALAALLTSDDLARLNTQRPERLPPIVLAAPKPGQPMAARIAQAVHDALLPRQGTGR
jgi:hypothetical protein